MRVCADESVGVCVSLCSSLRASACLFVCVEAKADAISLAQSRASLVVPLLQSSRR